MKRKGFLGGIIIAILLVLLAILAVICTTKVPAGYVAVQYSMNGGVKDEVLSQGWHIVPPTVHTTLYSTGIEQSYLTSGENGDSKTDESFSASSSEGKDITIDLTFTYQYQAENVTAVFTRFKGQSGQDVKDSFIKPNIISWTKEVVARYKVSDIIGAERASINTALTEYLAQKFEPYGITVSNVSLINVEVDKDTSDAINAKITAQQNAETQAINNKTSIEKAEADAQVKLTAAQAEADSIKVKAEADADALLVAAEAEAKANKMLNESLSDKVLENNFIEKWSGDYPDTYVSGDDASSIILTAKSAE